MKKLILIIIATGFVRVAMAQTKSSQLPASAELWSPAMQPTSNSDSNKPADRRPKDDLSATINPGTGLPLGSSDAAYTETGDALLGRVLGEASALTAVHRYEDALQRCIWFYNHAREVRPGASPVSVLPYWVELGRRYPKARQALMEVRDRATREIQEGRGCRELFSDLASINSEMQNDGATLMLFNFIHRQDQPLARQCFSRVEGLLVQKGEYALCLEYIGDPQTTFNSCRDHLIVFRRAADRHQKLNQPSADTDRQRGWTNTWPESGAREFMQKHFEDRFVSDTCQLIEILVGTGQKTVAEKIRDQAVVLLNDPRLKSAVSDAEEKIQKRSISTDKK